MAHVFIVDEKTFSTHLKYKFAGTGAKEYKCYYLEDNNIEIEPSVERLLSGMIADISRVKKGDSVIFYLQQTKKHEGMFFGSFIVKDNPFLCNDDFLKDELGKNLTFRVELVPNKVYKYGITERECLDSLKNIEHPSQMCWSLIYRKLKGNRGCTMITNYEYNQIMEKIKLKNDNKYMQSNNFDYDKENNQIISFDKELKYKGKKESLNIKNRLLYKKKRRNAYESHLQAYILQNLSEINCLKINNDKLTWIGNEVSCGVGMQSIDICFVQENEKEANIAICELKDEQPKEYIKNQLEKYVEWIKDYIIPTYDKRVVLNPIIVAPKQNSKTERLFSLIKDSLIFKSKKVEVNSMKYIEFEEENNEILFKEVCDEK